MNNLLIVSLLVALSCGEIIAQQKELQGKITNIEEVDGIHVLNNGSRFNTVTDEFGNFSISAKVNDTIVFSSVHYIAKKIPVTSKIFESGIIVVTLTKVINELDEVFLGTRLTGDLERDVKNAKVKTPINFHDVGIPGFLGEPEEKIPTLIGQTIGPTHVNIEALYNYISGYYKMLRTQREWEAENTAVAVILFKYDEEFFFESYGIPKNRTFDFLLFCLETTTLERDFYKSNHGRVLDVFAEKSKIYTTRLEEGKTPEKKE